MNIEEYFVQIRKDLSEARYDQLTSHTLDKPEYFNWAEDVFYKLNVREFPDDQALIWKYGEHEKTYTFKEIYQLSNQLINLLRRHGAGTGDHIYSLLSLVPANWISFLATIKGGFILMPTAINLTARDLTYRYESLFPEIVIADQANAEKIDEAEQAFGKKSKIKVLVGGERAGWVGLDNLHQEDMAASAVRTKADDPVLYFFTSGTTGLPKIVVHTHFTYGVGHLTTSSWVGCCHGDVHYNISSPGWAKFAWSSFFAPWNTGATIFTNQVDAFVPHEQLASMSKYGVTTFCGSPTVLRMLIQQDLSKYDLKLKRSAAAGEPLNPDVIDKWEKGTGITIRDGYGQTETTALVGNLPDATIKPGSMGKATFLYDVGIYNEEGVESAPLEEGVICVNMKNARHNGIFNKYLSDSERTKAVFKHGLYYTGDKAYKDMDGYIWFVGRNDDVIKASGYRIGPFEVESVLIEHPDVAESAVVASPHEVRGNAVKAYIMLREGVLPTEELAKDIFDFAASQLTAYKVPRIIEFPMSLPKTISGKIRRIELRAQEAKNRIESKKVPDEYFHIKY